MTTIAQRIAERRESLGLAVDVAASLSDLDPTRWRAIEHGGPVTAWELHAAAGALAIDPSMLRTDTGAGDARWSSARFRAPMGVEHLSGQDVRTLARVAEAARLHAGLSQLLGLAVGQVESCRAVQAVKGTPWEHGYALGKAARELLHPKREGIPSVQALLERLGVLVVTVHFDTKDVDGASLFERGASPAILLNASSPRVAVALRRRAVLAHELCHVLHDSTIDRDLVTVVSRADETSPVEARANGFAPSFLAPKHWVKVSARTPVDRIAELGSDWGLSFGGAAWHAKNLQLVSPAAAKTAKGGIAATKFEPTITRRDPASVGLEITVSELAHSVLGDLAIDAAASELISSGRAAEILTLR